MSGKTTSGGDKTYSRAVLLAALVLWGVAAAAFAFLPVRLGIASLAVYAAAAGFALFRMVLVTRGRPEFPGEIPGIKQVFWGLFCVGIVLRFVGDASWGVRQLAGVGTSGLWMTLVVYGSAYALLCAAMLVLISRTTRRLLTVATLDAASVMLSVGMLAWYFVLGPATLGGSEEFGNAAAILAIFSVEGGLLFLCLMALSSERRPPFAGLLAAGFTAFFVADGLYFFVQSRGSYASGNWSEMLWALGFILFGLAAARSLPAPGSTAGDGIHPWRVFSFWLGPLSPAVHLAVLLAWGAIDPPLPSYVLIGGSAIVLYLAFRISLTAYVSRRIRLEDEKIAVRLEQGRISEELHDTLDQSIHRMSLLLESYDKAREHGDPKADDILADTIAAAREASYQVGRPIDELRARWAGVDQDPSPLLGRLIEDFEQQFGITPHQDLRADLGKLSPEELATAYRIASEALWNAAKHSQARNVWLESREVGPVTIVRVRDDGKGFSQKQTVSGYGLASMRSRAEQSGSELDIISDPLSGTTVQVRFES